VVRPIPVFPVPREHMLIILGNLAENALDAMPEGGKLTITLEPADSGHVRLSVQDTGVGLSTELMERLFEPFMTTKGELVGGSQRKSGMGLAVVYGLVSEMHGTITARNSSSGGAVFEVLLPTAAYGEVAGCG
jgi:signal transduction histidine kinase